ncbi:MAG TPA: HlyD family efflux transporter periplasmic adaptor subunit [Devosia sp.]|nr:HlyD family efflux transporter periplasmic adaptor subunit [Devosia sp.]
MSDFFGGLLAAILAFFSPSAPSGFTGYIEADYVYVAPVSAGRITKIAVAEGQAVAEGDLLLVLDQSQQQARLAAAEARVAAARATLQNLETGSRREELDVIRASLSKAEADLGLARTNLARSEQLEKAGTVSAAKVEVDRNALAAAEAQVNQLQAQLAVAELPARSGQQVAAEANLAAAEADAEGARLDLGERLVHAPAAGVIEKLYYAAGEVAAVGTPIASILPAGALEARFFVPETARSSLAVGQAVTVTCDGCAAMAASVVHIASEPQTTPPVIYSTEERSRLVYLVEARLDEAAKLQPGQPVTVLP